MYLYDNKQFKGINEIKENYNLISYQHIMRSCGAGTGIVSSVMASLNIKSEKIIANPSGKIIQLYKAECLQPIMDKVGISFRNDKIPSGYITKKEFANLFNIKVFTVNNMSTYFKDFNKYAEYFYVNNIRTKYFFINDVTYGYYKERVEKYITPLSERLKKSKQALKDNLRDYSEGNIHKIAFDYEVMAEIFDTQSKYFKMLIQIYKKYAKLQVADSSVMDNHHIIPRFYEGYIFVEDLENTIYLPREVHLLVHILEYRCAYPDFKTKFFTSFCVLCNRIDSSKINENAFNEIIKALCNSLDIY